MTHSIKTVISQYSVPIIILFVWIIGCICDAWMNRANPKLLVVRRYAIAMFVGVVLASLTLPFTADRVRDAKLKALQIKTSETNEQNQSAGEKEW